MNNESNKELEFSRLQKEWRDHSVNQLSNVNNIFLGLSSGLYIYLMNIDCQTFFFSLSVFALSISILFGLGVLFSRLYDFRISRRLNLIRKRYYKEYEKDDLPRNDLGSISCKDRTKALYKILFHELPVITLEIIKKNDEWKNDFKKLRELSIVLGNATWRWTKIQIISFLISGFAYTLFHFLHV